MDIFGLCDPTLWSNSTRPIDQPSQKVVVELKLLLYYCMESVLKFEKKQQKDTNSKTSLRFCKSPHAWILRWTAATPNMSEGEGEATGDRGSVNSPCKDPWWEAWATDARTRACRRRPSVGSRKSLLVLLCGTTLLLVEVVPCMGDAWGFLILVPATRRFSGWRFGWPPARLHMCWTGRFQLFLYEHWMYLQNIHTN